MLLLIVCLGTQTSCERACRSSTLQSKSAGCTPQPMQRGQESDSALVLIGHDGSLTT